MDVDVIVEIPKGSRNKYEYDLALDRIRLDRMLFTATGYPSDYGFVPDTLAEDGDPIDALVLLAEPTFPGCLVRARVIGVFWMRDTNGPDAKLLCVPATDPRHAHLQDLGDVPMHQISEIWHFFEIYEALEPDKSAEPIKASETRGWERRKEAVLALEDAQRRFAEQHALQAGTHA
ncbi:inorganic diphosphatase [Blastococcus sp. CT_GayMR16]|uniref:inorganic diphosphatase n=1 Tax=Blastococcus sp. CT_GayMR16 TaxID=2559607 RepID=UPI0010743FCC|nr:inorganic diphosphatase [Blastococcus sp. CT_GayMR16]TFV90031.1 inorganic diphosphatase [Blastococcus sp. CT_GayMR16]